MNKERRKAIEDLKIKIGSLASQIEELKEEAESLRDEEQEYYDNMPEGFQNGEKGEKAQASIDALDEIVSGIESAFDSLQESENQCDNAVE